MVQQVKSVNSYVQRDPGMIDEPANKNVLTQAEKLSHIEAMAQKGNII